jgi:predicted Zn-dependent peptidase
VIQEIWSVEDTPEEYVQELMFRHFFKGHPLSKFLLGTVETVSAFSRDIAFNFMKDHYYSGNLIISGAGNIVHNEFVELVWENFKNIITGITPDGFFKINFNPEKVVVVQKPLEQIHLCIGFEGTRYGEKRRYSLSLFSTIFGTSNSSRLFQEIREKRGWAYDVYSFTHSYGDTGVFGIYLATRKEYVKDVIKIVLDQLVEIKDRGFKEEEIEIAKQNLVSSFLISSENTDVSMLRLSKNYLYTGNLVSCEEVVRNIKEVENEELKDIADKLLDLNRTTFVFLGDIREEEILDIF